MISLTQLEQEVALHALQTDRLPLADANTSINQCHVVALRIAELRMRIHSLSLQELDFVTLSVQTSPPITLHDPIATPSKISGWYLLYLDYRKAHSFSTNVTKQEREKERQGMEQLGKTLLASRGQDPRKLALEGAIFSHIREQGTTEVQDLCDQTSLVLPGQRLRTFPKYVGIQHVSRQQAAMQSPPPIIVKIKYVDEISSYIEVLYAKNWHAIATPISDGTEMDLGQPALVIEGVALPEGMTYNTYSERARNCPHHLFLRDRTGVHKEGETCPGCTHSKEAKRWRVPLPEESIGITIQKISAIFQKTYQPTLPPGGEEMEMDIQRAEQEGLSYSNPRVWVIEHIHVNTVRKALEPRRFIDQSPRAALSREGL